MEPPIFPGRALDQSGERYRLLSETNLFGLIGTRVNDTFHFQHVRPWSSERPGPFRLAYTKRIWTSVLRTLPYR